MDTILTAQLRTGVENMLTASAIIAEAVMKSPEVKKSPLQVQG
jgi:hypothetical protein